MITRTNYGLLGTIVFAFFAIALFLTLQSVFPATAQAVSTEPTFAFDVTKKFSEHPAGYRADQFTFDITGTSASGTAVSMLDIPLTGGEITASTQVYLPVGTYTITEDGPVGFMPGEWTVQWSGYGCSNANGPTLFTTMTVKANDPTANVCTADNQWRPGKLRIEKVFVGTSTAPENFEFAVAQGAVEKYNGPFESDGINEMTIEAGDYAVVETVYGNYTPSYSEGCTGTIAQGGSETCTITNTYNPPEYSQSSYYSQGSYGGGNEDPTYLVFGYVWHDENSNMCWEGTNCSEEDATTTEPDLDGWTVEITNGETTFSTTTDETGYYSFMVPAGTWTINEVLQQDWVKTFPADNGHVVVVGLVTQDEDSNFFATVFHFLIQTAHAQAPESYGPFNFEGVFSGSSYSQGSYGGGNPYSQGSYGGGNGKKIELSSSGGGGGTTDPVPEVLGEAATVIPVGAPATGAGGTAPVAPTLPSLFAILTSRTFTRISKNG